MTIALIVRVRRLTGLPGSHDRQVRLSFRGEARRGALRIFATGGLPFLLLRPPNPVPRHLSSLSLLSSSPFLCLFPLHLLPFSMGKPSPGGLDPVLGVYMCDLWEGADN